MKLQIIFYFLLIIFNLVSLYFIIALFSYDEIAGYIVDGGKRIDFPRNLIYLFFITSLLNLYFLSLHLMELFFKEKL